MTSSLPSALHEDRRHGTDSFRCAHYTAPDDDIFTVPPHWHEELEIIYFEQGQFSLEINLEHFSVDSECLFFIRSGELHRILCEEPCRESAVVFSPYLLGFVANDAAQNEVLLPLSRQRLLLPRSLSAKHPAFPLILSEYRRLTRHCPVGVLSAPPPAAQQLQIKAALLNILGLLCEHSLLQISKEADNGNVEAVKAVLSHIHTHYQEKITVNQLASLISLNEQYFCRFFKKAVGQSPISYLNSYRIRRAIDLLDDTDLPVTDICLECGFNNLGNFLREFRRHTGTTPLRYRRTISPKKSK